MKYKVAGTHPAYDTAVDDVVTLDANDPAVKLNVAAGILVAQERPAMTCPTCRSADEERVVASVGELEAHYGEAHPAHATPEWRED